MLPCFNLIHFVCDFTIFNDDVIKWKLFSRNWPFVRGIHRLPEDFLYKGQWHVALMFSLICFWTNCRANNRDADDLKRHGAHYDVNATCIQWNMSLIVLKSNSSTCSHVKFIWPNLLTFYTEHNNCSVQNCRMICRLRIEMETDVYMRRWIGSSWIRYWLVTCSTPSHYLIQWRHIVI